MPNLDPQLAAEFAALEKLRLAVLQYRDEVIDLRKSRGLTALSDIPRIEVELPEEFQALVTAAKEAAPVAPPPVVVPEPVRIPEPVFAVPAPVAPPVIAIPVPVAPPEPVAPPVVASVSPAAIASTEAAPATEPAETFDERVRTAPFAPITSPNQVYMPQARAESLAEPPPRTEPGLLLGATANLVRPANPEITEIKASAAAPAPIAPRAEARSSDNTRTPTPVFSPSIPGRRPGMSQSMQTETVGSFLRRFRLAND